MDKRDGRPKAAATSTTEGHDAAAASSLLPALLSSCRLRDSNDNSRRKSAKSFYSHHAYQVHTPRDSDNGPSTRGAVCAVLRTPELQCLSPPLLSTRPSLFRSKSSMEASGSSASLPGLRTALLAAGDGSASPSRERQRQQEPARSFPRTPQPPSPYVPASTQSSLHRLRGCADRSSTSLSGPKAGDHAAHLLKTPTGGQGSSSDSTGGRLNSGTQRSIALLKMKTPPFFKKFKENPEFFNRRLALSDESDDSEDDSPARQHEASAPSSPSPKSSPPKSHPARELPSKSVLAKSSSPAKGLPLKTIPSKVPFASQTANSARHPQQRPSKSSATSKGGALSKPAQDPRPRPTNKENTVPSEPGPRVAYGVNKEPRNNGRSRAPSAPQGCTLGDRAGVVRTTATQGGREVPSGWQPSMSEAGPVAAPSARQRSLLSLLKDPKPPEENYYTVINGRKYHMLSLIGKGGSSKVFVMFDQRKNLCAVKIVSMADIEPGVMKMFLNEVGILKALRNCERVVKLYDYEFNREDKVLALVMEKGDQDLASILASMTKKGPLSSVTIKFYWSEMLLAVLEIHNKGVIHSDLKPANFLFAGGKLKLIDFGIADTMQADVTSVLKETPMGTLNFMSPESIEMTSHEPGKRYLKISRKSDVWSLGCILYHLAYGKTPFQHLVTVPEKVLAITSNKHVIDFPPLPNAHLREVLVLCLQRDAKQRPTISQLLEHPYLVDGGVTPAPKQLRKENLQSMFNEIESLSPGSVQKLTEVVKSLRQRKH